MQKVIWRCFLLLLALGAASSLPALERPPGLEPEIQFWTKVFTEVTTQEGFVHDNRRLDIIYETLRFPGNPSAEQRRRQTNASVQRYERILNDLASGQRNGLSAEHRRVLELWGPDVSNAELREAARRVRFQLGQSDRFQEGLIRSGLWADHIERTLAAHGVPPEVIALPHVESAFHPGARSHAGAAGLWQFMPGTGQRFMRVDALMDERLDPFRSTEAAAQLLRLNHQATGTWALALSAYNHGTAGIQRAIRAMGTTDIETIVRHYDGRAFGFASRNFYVSFLAAVDVRQNADRYFGPVQRLRPESTTLVVLPGYAPLSELAVQLGVDRATLTRLNPSLRAPLLDGSKLIPRGYALRVPGDLAGTPDALLAGLPASLWQAQQIPDLYHVVQRGETLSVIAPRYGTTVQTIVNLNGLSNAHMIRAGQRLVLPGAPEAARAVAAASSAPPAPAPSSPTPPAAPQTAAATAAGPPAAPVTPPPAAAAARSQPAPVPAPEARPAAASASSSTPVIPALTDDEYSVAADGTIVVREEESLGHYADWLRVPTNTLRQRNAMSGSSLIRVGDRLHLDFSRISREEFEQRRRAHHHAVQDRFLTRYRVAAVTEHVVRAGESVWLLAERQYGVPFWLLRRYNPDLDFTQVRPGTRMMIPQLERAEA